MRHRTTGGDAGDVQTMRLNANDALLERGEGGAGSIGKCPREGGRIVAGGSIGAGRAGTGKDDRAGATVGADHSDGNGDGGGAGLRGAVEREVGDGEFEDSVHGRGGGRVEHMAEAAIGGDEGEGRGTEKNGRGRQKDVVGITGEGTIGAADDEATGVTGGEHGDGTKARGGKGRRGGSGGPDSGRDRGDGPGPRLGNGREAAGTAHREKQDGEQWNIEY